MSELIRIDLIDKNLFQTRLGIDPDHIQQLADDIFQNGLLQVPAGRMVGERVQLAFGHNRLEAYRLLARIESNYRQMPVNIQDLTDEQMGIMAWSENEKRQQLNPVERSMAVERMQKHFGWDQNTLAEKLGVGRSTIANMLRMLKLPKTILDNVLEGKLSQRQAMAFLPLYDLSEKDLEWIMADRERAEFIQLARFGSFDSDTIRDKVTAFLQQLLDTKPKQLEIQPEPEPEGVDASLYDQAVELLKKNRSTSPTRISRDLRISYPRAMQIYSQMREKGLIDTIGILITRSFTPAVVKPVEAPAPAAQPASPEETPCEETDIAELDEDCLVDVLEASPDKTAAEVAAECLRANITELPRELEPAPAARKPEPVPAAPEPEKLTVSITWLPDVVMLGIRKEGGTEMCMPIFKSLPSLPLYEIALKLAGFVPGKWKELIK